MSVNLPPGAKRTEAAALAQLLQPFATPDVRKAVVQLVNSVLPYVGLWVVMAAMLLYGLPYWSILPFCILASGFLVRIFILFHDCCHGSLFASRRANRIVGTITGVLSFTPFEQWRRSHAMHHDTVGDLDRRGVGDIWTMTAAEYRSAPRWKKTAYRIIRNPVFVLTFGTIVIFLVVYRFPHRHDRTAERRSVIVTNLIVACIVALVSFAIGLENYLLIQLTTTIFSGAAGLWLFYVQHQFEGTYWARHEEWDPIRAALEGSSFYKLPKILQWFTGNIGFHHIHHANLRIPNYNLERCYREVPLLQQVKPLTLLQSFKSARLHLWDEGRRILTGYRIPAA
jgi:acyl-lipid omega-6 desaturase (Delta-12 desaturase)